MKSKTHPGVHIPPPLIYAAFFLLSVLLQKFWHFGVATLHTLAAHVFAWLALAAWVWLAFASLRQFALTKNTIITVKPASSLQTAGIYAFSRNPMYLSLLCLYVGLGVFFGNWWTFLLLPLLVAVIDWYVIGREERYLRQAFGVEYKTNCQNVRRWL